VNGERVGDQDSSSGCRGGNDAFVIAALGFGALGFAQSRDASRRFGP